MTHNQLLDAILSSYLYGLKLKLEKDRDYRKLKFKTVAKAQDPTVDDWNIEFLKKRLLDDGFLKQAEFGDEEPFELTPAGIKAAQTRWYTSHAEEKQLDNEIKKQTLLSLKSSKDAKVISIIAVIVPTIISICSLWITTKQSTMNGTDQIKLQIDTLQHEQKRLKMLLPNLQVISIDSLQKGGGSSKYVKPIVRK